MRLPLPPPLHAAQVERPEPRQVAQPSPSPDQRVHAHSVSPVPWHTGHTSPCGGESAGLGRVGQGQRLVGGAPHLSEPPLLPTPATRQPPPAPRRTAAAAPATPRSPPARGARRSRPQSWRRPAPVGVGTAGSCSRQRCCGGARAGLGTLACSWSASRNRACAMTRQSRSVEHERARARAPPAARDEASNAPSKSFLLCQYDASKRQQPLGCAAPARQPSPRDGSCAASRAAAHRASGAGAAVAARRRVPHARGARAAFQRG